MRPFPAFPFVLAMLPVLAGCAGERTPAAGKGNAATNAPLPEAAPPAPAPAPDDSRVTMRYACEAGVRVDILREGIARVALPDGRVVELSRIADSVPPVFTGEALYFSIGDEGASLSQDEGTELACRGE